MIGLAFSTAADGPAALLLFLLVLVVVLLLSGDDDLPGPRVCYAGARRAAAAALPSPVI